VIVFPAIDLLEGRVVKLDAETHTAASHDFGTAEAVAARWLDEGATHLHVVDLDGALGTGRPNREEAAAIVRLAAGRAEVYLGGGLREARVIGEYINGIGVSRAIVGTRAVTDGAWLRMALRIFPSRLVVAIDAVDGQVVAKGWQEMVGVDVVEFVKRGSEWPIAGFLYTNVGVEGRQQGVDWAPVERLVQATGKPVIFSGGITTLAEIRRFRDLGVFGVVLGSALYSGAMGLREAIEAAGGR